MNSLARHTRLFTFHRRRGAYGTDTKVTEKCVVTKVKFSCFRMTHFEQKVDEGIYLAVCSGFLFKGKHNFVAIRRSRFRKEVSDEHPTFSADGS